MVGLTCSPYSTKERGITGCRFLRQEQTYHIDSRKFYENEVFRTSPITEFLLSEITGRCCVLFIRDYVQGISALFFYLRG